MKHSHSKSKKSVPFIVPNKEGQFLIQQEGAKLFETQIDPFGIIVSTGLIQTRKSTLLNRLIGDESAFQVNSTEQVTKGIWATRIFLK